MFSMWNSMILYFESLLSFGLEKTELFIFSLFVFVLVFLAYLLFSKILSKKIVKHKENLIYQYDYIIYILSWFVYKYSDGTKVLDEYLFNPLFKSKNLQYTKNYKLIFEAVEKIQSELAQNIIQDSEWKKISKLNSKIWFYKKTLLLFKIILVLSFLLIVSLFVYFKYLT